MSVVNNPCYPLSFSFTFDRILFIFSPFPMITSVSFAQRSHAFFLLSPEEGLPSGMFLSAFRITNFLDFGLQVSFLNQGEVPSPSKTLTTYSATTFVTLLQLLLSFFYFYHKIHPPFYFANVEYFILQGEIITKEDQNFDDLELVIRGTIAGVCKLLKIY